jgi:DNA-binding NarL/FixJ family response regulator
MQKRLIIADDHAVVRTGLQLILDETNDMAIVDEARNGEELLQKLGDQAFDLVILDISMPGMDALDVLKKIKESFPKLPVAIFTMNPDEMYAMRMIKAGASAYINKETKSAQLIEIFRHILSGKRHFTQRQTELMAEAFTNPAVAAHENLTDREFQIMFMLSSGLRKTEIAEKLNLSKNTVGNHRNNIMKKMNLSSNSELTRYAIQHGIIK